MGLRDHLQGIVFEAQKATFKGQKVKSLFVNSKAPLQVTFAGESVVCLMAAVGICDIAMKDVATLELVS